MKASELIADLKKAVLEHGDMDVLVRDCSDGFDWSGITVCPDPPSPMEVTEGISGTIDLNVYDDSQAPDQIKTLAEQDAKLELLWAELEDVPVDPYTEKLEDDWFIFPRGTDKEDIWHWFDERHSKGVAYLLYCDGVDRTPDMAQLCYRKQLCEECMSETCIFNPEGICMFPIISGRPPLLNDDGCEDYCYNEKADMEEDAK